MKLYRVENLTSGRGLWYNTTDASESNLVKDLKLTAGVLPMDFDDALFQAKWKSAAGSLEQLKYWFTHEDLLRLIPLDFHLYEIEADIVSNHKTDLYEHPLFQEIGVKTRTLLDINDLLK